MIEIPVASAATQAGLTRQRIAVLISEGRIKARKDDAGRWLVNEDSLKAYIEQDRKAGRPVGSYRSPKRLAGSDSSSSI